MSKPDAFDPQARCVDEKGYAYANAAAYLKGEPCLEDLGNDYVARFLAEGRGEAFCRDFRQRYDSKLEELHPGKDITAIFRGRIDYQVFVKAHAAGFAAATDPFRGHA